MPLLLIGSMTTVVSRAPCSTGASHSAHCLGTAGHSQWTLHVTNCFHIYLQADNSIAGSIAAIAAKAPAPPPKADAPACGGGMNLLDFGDDEGATPATPASSDPMALLDQLSDPAPPKAAAPADDDWADFISTEPAEGGAGTTGQGDWAPFTGAAQPGAADKGDDWADFASAPGAGAADPFGVPAGRPAAASSGFSGAAPSAGRQALPLDAFAAPIVEPIAVGTSSGVDQPSQISVAAAAPIIAAVKNVEEKKDPFADLLG